MFTNSGLPVLGGYVKSVWREHFHAPTYIAVALFITISIVLNYSFGIERGLVRQYFGKNEGIPVFILYYCFPYFATLFIEAALRKDFSLFKNKDFLKYVFFGLFLCGLDFGWYFYHYFGNMAAQGGERYWVLKTTATLTGAFTFGLGLFVWWWFHERKLKMPFYGITSKGFHTKPYLILTAIVIIGVSIASFHPQFTAYYPTLKLINLQHYFKYPHGLLIGIYEFFYGLNFMWTELIFRGFFVVAVCRFGGNSVILPMVSLYAYRHFGKPMAETISSCFGGYILGAIAIKSKNIWGGALLHFAVAVTMDLASIAQLMFK